MIRRSRSWLRHRSRRPDCAAPPRPWRTRAHLMKPTSQRLARPLNTNRRHNPRRAERADSRNAAPTSRDELGIFAGADSGLSQPLRVDDMKDVIRLVLVDPNEESRDVLQQLLGTVGSLWIAEVFTTYQGVAAKVADIAPDLCLVTLDSNPAQALELIGSLSQLSPDGV